MIKENKNFKIEQEAFLLKCHYEKELHSNKNSLQTLGFMSILIFGALAFQAKQEVTDSNFAKQDQKVPVSACSQKVDALYLKENEKLVHSR